MPASATGGDKGLAQSDAVPSLQHSDVSAKWLELAVDPVELRLFLMVGEGVKHHVMVSHN